MFSDDFQGEENWPCPSGGQGYLCLSRHPQRLSGRLSGFYLMVQLGSSDDLALALRDTDRLPIRTDEDQGRAVDGAAL